MTDNIFKISLQELCTQEGFNKNMAIEVVEHGIAQPLTGDHYKDWIFESNSVYWMKKAIRLYHDLEIDWVAIAIVIDLLQQQDSLTKENDCLKMQLNRFLNRS